MASLSPVEVAPRVLHPDLNVGDYFCTERDLYRVEEVHGQFALIEDCMREMVLEVAVEEILTMTPVRRTAGVS